MWVLMKRKERDGPTCILLLKRKELMARPWRPSYAPSIEKEMYPRMLTLFSLFIGLMAHKNPSLGHQPVKRKENNHARVTFDRQPEVEGLEGPIEGPTGGYPFFHEDLSPALQRSWKKEAISRQWHRMLVFPFQELLLDPQLVDRELIGLNGKREKPNLWVLINRGSRAYWRSTGIHLTVNNSSWLTDDPPAAEAFRAIISEWKLDHPFLSFFYEVIFSPLAPFCSLEG